MISIPSAAEPLLMSLCIAFTKPTFQRFLALCVGAILTTGRRTITSLLWTMRSVVSGHYSSYHRVFSRAPWSLWPLGKVLATAVLKWIPPDESIVISADDTTAQHRGKQVYAKGCHHDAVRSARGCVVFRWGHRWVVLAICVKFPFASRRWALPVLAALYRPKELNKSEGRRHKTSIDLARGLTAVLMRWFPHRRFILLGDGGYASHGLAAFCHRHRRRAALVSRFRADANLYELPPKRSKGQIGRPRIKGRKLPSPKEVVAAAKRTKATVSWYGGGTRRVELVSGKGHWYRAGAGLVHLRWVFVHDAQGTHRDDYFYTTDLTLTPVQIVSLFNSRWPIETTFQEMRAHLGFETPRQRVAKSVLRMAPCLLGLFTIVCLIYAEQSRRGRLRVRRVAWYKKQEPTFSDTIASVRRLFWSETILKGSSHGRTFKKLPPELRDSLLDWLSMVA